MAERMPRAGEEVLEKPQRKTREPRLFQVILHNDDYTPMDFVVEVLESVFHKGPAEAYGIMMRVHVEGRGVAGVYPHEVAETRVDKVHELARLDGYPLLASLEEV